MPSEREIDNYIDKMEEENVIYIDKELEYAEKCHKLEEQVGCPLEVIVKALEYGIYAKDLPREDLTKYFGLKLSDRDSEWYLSNDIMAVNLKDYKKTFWLQEDKSE